MSEDIANQSWVVVESKIQVNVYQSQTPSKEVFPKTNEPTDDNKDPPRQDEVEACIPQQGVVKQDPQLAPQTAPQQTHLQVPQKTPQQVLQQAPQQAPQQVPQKTPQQIPQQAPQQVPQQAPQEAPQQASPVSCVKLTDILPMNIAAILLKSHDQLSERLAKTIEKRLSHLDKCSVEVDCLDLSLPETYANTLQNHKKLLLKVIGRVLQKISSVKQLCLPTSSIDVLTYLVSKILKDNQNVKIILPFCEQDETAITTKLPKLIKALISQNIKSIVCPPSPSMKHVDIRAPECQLKTELLKLIKDKEEMIVIYDGFDIKKGTEFEACEIEPSDLKVPNSSKKQSSTGLKVKLLPKYPTTNTEIFSFDSACMSQYASDNHFTPYSYWRLDTIHHISTGRGMRLAVVDTGIDPSHPAFGNIEFHDFTGNSFSTESCGHGTVCAGIACGKEFEYFPYLDDEQRDITHNFLPGVAPNTTLVICKVVSANKYNADAVVKALQWLKGKKVDVVSFSLGTLHFSPEIAQAITALVDDKVTIVCAASNEGQKFSQRICFPARLGHVLCIGSHGPHGKPSAFSPVGQDIDFLAPGEGVAGPSSSIYNHHVRVDSGTSYAAPAVAGLICLVFELIKKKCPDEFHHFKNPWVVKELLREISASPRSHSSDRGYGSLNPLSFFKQPSGVLQKIWSEVILPSI